MIQDYTEINKRIEAKQKAIDAQKKADEPREGWEILHGEIIDEGVDRAGR